MPQYTNVDKNNPANATGTLHTVKVYPVAPITALRVGTFYTTNSNTLKCRDSELLGDVAPNAESTFTGLSIAVVTGDYIGCYFAYGFISAQLAGFPGLWIYHGESIDPGDEAEYDFFPGPCLSLYGIGEGPA